MEVAVMGMFNVMSGLCLNMISGVTVSALQGPPEQIEAYDHLVVNGIMPSYDKIFGYQDPIMVSIPENSSPVEHETHKGDSMFQMLQDVLGLIGEHVDMDIDRRRHMEGNKEGSSEQCVEGYSLEEKRFENLIADANIELYPGSSMLPSHCLHGGIYFTWSFLLSRSMADQHSTEGASTSESSGGSSESVVELNIKTLDSQIYSFHPDKNKLFRVLLLVKG
ncbi:hypothetical protein Ancab_004696 [Ancistrocladus abbreviatus]